MFETPNLDCMTTDELVEFNDVVLQLGRYARHKKLAMRFRDDGLIQFALKHEAITDAIYQNLPEWARW